MRARAPEPTTTRMATKLWKNVKQFTDKKKRSIVLCKKCRYESGVQMTMTMGIVNGFEKCMAAKINVIINKK